MRACVCLLMWLSCSVALAAEPALPQWIGLAREAPAATTFLRHRFTLPDDAAVDYADLLVAADRQATVFLNGQRLGDARGVERFAHFPAHRALRGGDNVLAIQLIPGSAPAAIASLQVALAKEPSAAEQTKVSVVTGDDWKLSTTEAKDWTSPDFDASDWKPAAILGPIGARPWGTPTTEAEHYHQWKQALGATAAVDPRLIQVADGYAIELLRSAQPGEGSWISLAFDPQGRLIVGREDKGLLRFTLPELTAGKLLGPEAVRQIQIETIDDTLLECRGLLFVGRDLYAQANNSKGLYRLRDTDDNDTFDEVTLLREMPGDVGHGRNDLTLGPDGKLYLMLGNDVRFPTHDQPGTSPLRHFAQDKLLPCVWNQYLFNAGVAAPGGYVIRTDLEAKTWEVVAGGFRNAYGVAFNTDGEMFTYDSDMEWDAGAPWYRPTRINHIVSGGDYGWRQGTDKWREWYPDSLPTTFDVGLGSPTTVKFAPREANFGLKYRDALFALDWAYGRILAIHLEPHGASYTGRMETFISGRPLNVCDLEFGPDGAMYFVTGGRRTQSGLYRVVRQQNSDTPPAGALGDRLRQAQAEEARALRKKLEQFHGRIDAEAVATAWPHLAHDDPWIRHAARVAIEAQPASEWAARALSELDPVKAATALLALARCGDRSVQPRLLARAGELPWDKLDERTRLVVLRACQGSLARHRDIEAAPRQALRERLDQHYPARSVRENDLLCELLVYLESPTVVERTLPLIDAAPTPEEKLHYLMSLRLVRAPWTLDQRKAYFTWLQRADGFPAAHYLPRFVAYIRQDAIATLSDQERAELGALLEPAATTPEADAGPPRPFVKAWTLDDFAAELDQSRKVDPEQGRQLFIAAQCHRCHRIGSEGALVGPDLTGVGKRFGKRDLLLSILDPSRVIDDKYKQRTIVTTRGVAYTGQAVATGDGGIALVTDPTQPTRVTRIPHDEIEADEPSPLSPMPSGLINTLTHDEVLALLDYLAASTEPKP